MIYVKNKYTGEVHRKLEETSIEASRKMFERALRGSRIMKDMPSHQRAEILDATAASILKKQKKLAETIAIEAGKPIKYSMKEARRASVTMGFSGEEAKRIYGETIPFDAEPRGEGKFAYWIREPMGVIFAITPFNDPLNLVAHKLGPALASGNSIIIKPTVITPLSAINLVDLTVASGLPEECAQTLLSSGGSQQVREMLQNEKVKMVTITGGPDAAADVMQHSGIKKYSMELGSNSPAIVWEDADLDEAIPDIVDAAFESQGQNCIHAQRILIHERVYDETKERIVDATKRLKLGDPLSEDTDVGPMIAEGEARRVETWVKEAARRGGRILVGGKRKGSIYYPTVLERVPPKSTIAQKEVFGPVTILSRVSSLEQAVELSNSVPYGLQAGVFTNDIGVAQRFIDELDYGGVLINQSSDFRVDFMPFGGFKFSGLGREGIRFAIEAMTEIKLVVYKKKARRAKDHPAMVRRLR